MNMYEYYVEVIEDEEMVEYSGVICADSEDEAYAGLQEWYYDIQYMNVELIEEE